MDWKEEVPRLVTAAVGRGVYLAYFTYLSTLGSVVHGMRPDHDDEGDGKYS